VSLPAAPWSRVRLGVRLRSLAYARSCILTGRFRALLVLVAYSRILSERRRPDNCQLVRATRLGRRRGPGGRWVPLWHRDGPSPLGRGAGTWCAGLHGPLTFPRGPARPRRRANGAACSLRSPRGCALPASQAGRAAATVAVLGVPGWCQWPPPSASEPGRLALHNLPTSGARLLGGGSLIKPGSES
jgi:hypothetical protein